ncbi:MAG: DUF2922 domain-containing protein [Alicyclobacillus sp.]|nr:DUF2922 domain-containing protein [Alicyclobacillus sp.]
MATKSALQLQFLTDQNKKVRITVPNPKQPVDQAAVDQAMDVIVAKNVFAYPQGVLVKKISATLVDTNTTDIG